MFPYFLISASVVQMLLAANDNHASLVFQMPRTVLSLPHRPERDRDSRKHRWRRRQPRSSSRISLPTCYTGLMTLCYRRSTMKLTWMTCECRLVASASLLLVLDRSAIGQDDLASTRLGHALFYQFLLL